MCDLLGRVWLVGTCVRVCICGLLRHVFMCVCVSFVVCEAILLNYFTAC